MTRPELLIYKPASVLAGTQHRKGVAVESDTSDRKKKGVQDAAYQNHKSIHAIKSSSNTATFNASIWKFDIPGLYTDDERINFITEHMSMYGGHIATYWSTNSDEEGLIISSFNAWATMKSATQRFNRYAIKQGFTGMKITPQVYLKKGTQRTSNKSFKLMNVPRSVRTKEIEQALARILHHNSCILGLPDENNDINVTVQHDRAVNILNDTWCIDVGKHLLQLAPTYFQKSHLEQRNNHIGKFMGFRKDKPLGVMLDILTAHDAHFMYQKASDPNTYVKFANKSDLVANFIYVFGSDAF